jgi:hypothetical protein
VVFSSLTHSHTHTHTHTHTRTLTHLLTHSLTHSYTYKQMIEASELSFASRKRKMTCGLQAVLDGNSKDSS